VEKQQSAAKITVDEHLKSFTFVRKVD